jgi:hypothetical protein
MPRLLAVLIQPKYASSRGFPVRERESRWAIPESARAWDFLKQILNLRMSGIVVELHTITVLPM